MNFFLNSSFGSIPSMLFTWLKNYDIIDLEFEVLAINMNFTNEFRHFCFFFGSVNNKWLHSNLAVYKTSTLE